LSSTSIDSEFLIRELENLEKSIQRIREKASAGIHRKQPSRGIVDLDKFPWMRRDKTPALDTDKWAFCYVRGLNGTQTTEQKLLEQAVKNRGSYSDGRFRIQISKDRFFNREIP